MAIKIFSLNGVPDDEAEDVRALLVANEIDCHETAAGNWGISAAAIWLRDEARLDEALALIDAYQRERHALASAEYAALCDEGKQRTLPDVFREHPLRFLVYMAVIAAVVYFSIQPFLEIGK